MNYLAFALFPGLPILIVLLACIRQVNQYQRGVILTMGKFSKIWQPGWHIIIPVFQRMMKVDRSTACARSTSKEVIDFGHARRSSFAPPELRQDRHVLPSDKTRIMGAGIYPRVQSI